MQYYRRVLQADERLLVACRQHWIVFARAGTLLVLGLALLAVSTGWIAGTIVHQALFYGGLLALVLVPFYGLGAFLSWYTTEIAVTDRRIIYKRGLISRRTVEMNISKVETVDVDQGPLGRVLDFGNVVVRGTGGTFEPLRVVASPLALRNAILVG